GSRRRDTRLVSDGSSDGCSSDLQPFAYRPQRWLGDPVKKIGDHGYSRVTGIDDVKDHKPAQDRGCKQNKNVEVEQEVEEPNQFEHARNPFSLGGRLTSTDPQQGRPEALPRRQSVWDHIWARGRPGSCFQGDSLSGWRKFGSAWRSDARCGS